MKTEIMSFSAPTEYVQLVRARQRAEKMTRSEYFRKCVREEAERAAARSMLALSAGNTMDIGSLLAASGCR